MKETAAERNLNSELWHVCAGGMVQLPAEDSKVYYFPQGHAEHTLTTVEFGALPKIPPMILCRVGAVKHLADPETDEVYAKIGLIPVVKNESVYDEDGVVGGIGSVPAEKPASFAKTLTQSDANNGGGFSVPRYCAEMIFPRLDYTADPPVQNVIARDVHGDTWKFRHIYRGTPRRHLLTTGWSTFVNQKKLVAGDSIVFTRAENVDLCVGIRRAKRGGVVGGKEPSSVWNSGYFGGFSTFLKEDESKLMPRGVGNVNTRDKGKVRPESVLEAAFLAANGQPFEVVFYPRASTPEFCVKASTLNAAMNVNWCTGLRFKMPFETEDASRISWFMGTVASVQFTDPIRWPNSPWRLLQVTWDEPALMQNVKCVNPWLIEVVSTIPVLHLSPFSPTRKKMRFLHHPDFLLDGEYPLPSFTGNPLSPSSPLSCLSNCVTAGIQGARHAQIGVPLSDLHLSNKLQIGGLLVSASYPRPNPNTNNIPSKMGRGIAEVNGNISCLLSMRYSSQKSEKTDGLKTPRFLLFGQPILTEQQMSDAQSCNGVSKDAQGKSSSNGAPWKSGSYTPKEDFPNCLSSTQLLWKQGFCASELGLDTGQCKVFLESEDVGRTLDLSLLGSYDELYDKLKSMFGIEILEVLNHVCYCDASGVVKQAGNEPFSEFVKTAKRLTIVAKPPNNDGAKRKLINGLPTAERGMDSSNRVGPMSIFA